MKDKYTTVEVANLLDANEQRVQRYAIRMKLPKWGGRYIFSITDVKKMRKYFTTTDLIRAKQQ